MNTGGEGEGGRGEKVLVTGLGDTPSEIHEVTAKQTRDTPKEVCEVSLVIAGNVVCRIDHYNHIVAVGVFPSFFLSREREGEREDSVSLLRCFCLLLVPSRTTKVRVGENFLFQPTFQLPLTESDTST